jgi:cell pole-organizing protein PopZ
MSEPKRDDEPTMEEILASIRKIISEDVEDAVEDAPEPMELTQMVSEDGSVVDLRAERQANPKPAAKESLGEEPVGEEAAEAPTDPGSDEESESAVVELMRNW